MKVILAILVLGSGAAGQTTTRVSVDSNGGQGDNASGDGPSTVSADGRYVVFVSGASNFSPGNTYGVVDVFRRDRLTGTTEIISVDSSGGWSDDDSRRPAVSADGRFVAFESSATNLVAGDTNVHIDIFLHDCIGGTTQRVSVDSNGTQGNNDSRYPSISADGRYIAFESLASNLVVGDSNGCLDVFVRDRQTGTTRRVSVDSSGAEGNNNSYRAAISGDGRFVAFYAQASNLVPGDTNGASDAFIRDRIAGTTEMVSVSSSGAHGNQSSWDPSVSFDGRYVAFTSQATNLATSDTNGFGDVFVRDRLAGTTDLVSTDSFGAQSNALSFQPCISGDGQFVAFATDASNLFPGDTNACADVFLHDRITGLTQRVSASSNWAQGDGASLSPAISANGLFVTFQSDATNLVSGDSNHFTDVFIRDWTCTGAMSSYCTAKPNSLGCVPSIGSLGLPSQSGSDNFYVTASNVLNNKLGMMLWATSPASNPFGGGTLCLHSPIVRTPAQQSGGSPTGSDCTGSYAYHFTQGYMIQQLLGAYTTVYAQWWSRDPGFAVPNNIGLTNGLSFTICP